MIFILNISILENNSEKFLLFSPVRPIAKNKNKALEICQGMHAHMNSISTIWPYGAPSFFIGTMCFARQFSLFFFQSFFLILFLFLIRPSRNVTRLRIKTEIHSEKQNQICFLLVIFRLTRTFMSVLSSMDHRVVPLV